MYGLFKNKMASSFCPSYTSQRKIWCNTFTFFIGVKHLKIWKALAWGREAYCHEYIFLKKIQLNLVAPGTSLHAFSALFIQGFFAMSLQNELDKAKLKYMKTNFLLLFYWICHSWNFINTARRNAGQIDVYLSSAAIFTETEYFFKICCYLLSFFACHRKW